MAEELEGALPEDLDAWLSTKAQEKGRKREELVTRAVAAYRLIEDEELPEEGLEGIDDRLSTLEEGLVALEEDTDEKIEDVRERVIQVLQTAESKAPDDHEHPGIDERLDGVDDRVEGLAEDHETLADRVDGGFENYERILEHIRAETDELDEKTTTLARLVIDLRNRAAILEARQARKEALDELRTEANRAGIEAATCDDCGQQVRIGLLTAPKCPHCDAVFEDVEPARGFLGSSTLVVGERPALEGDVQTDEDPDDIFEGDDV